MAEIREDRPEIYLIPDNFIDEQRIINGLFRLRYFIEGKLMSLAVGIPLFLFVHIGFYPKIILIITACGPVFLFGNAGLNGDPISVAIRNYRSWKGKRQIMLFDNTPHALRKSLADATFEKEEARDKILNAVESIKDARREKASAVRYVEGETFEFSKDTELSEWSIEALREKEKEEKKRKAKRKKKEKAAPKPEKKQEIEVVRVFETLELPKQEEPAPAPEEKISSQPKLTVSEERFIIGEGELY